MLANVSYGLSRKLTRYGDEAFARFMRETFLESAGQPLAGRLRSASICSSMTQNSNVVARLTSLRRSPVEATRICTQPTSSRPIAAAIWTFLSDSVR